MFDLNLLKKQLEEMSDTDMGAAGRVLPATLSAMVQLQMCYEIEKLCSQLEFLRGAIGRIP